MKKFITLTGFNSGRKCLIDTKRVISILPIYDTEDHYEITYLVSNEKVVVREVSIEDNEIKDLMALIGE